jgi:hypothetical protein
MPTSKQIIDILSSPLRYDQFNADENGWSYVPAASAAGDVVAAGGKLTFAQTGELGTNTLTRGNIDTVELGPLVRLANIHYKTTVFLDPAHVLTGGAVVMAGVGLSGTNGAGDETGKLGYIAYLFSVEDGAGDGDVKLTYGRVDAVTILDLGVKLSVFTARPTVALQLTCTGSTFDAYIYVDGKLRAKEFGLTTTTFSFDVGVRPFLASMASIAGMVNALDDVSLAQLTVGGGGGGGSSTIPSREDFDIIDSITTTVVLTNTPVTGTLLVARNGVWQRLGVHYTFDSMTKTITWVLPSPLINGDWILAQYNY